MSTVCFYMIRECIGCAKTSGTLMNHQKIIKLFPQDLTLEFVSMDLLDVSDHKERVYEHLSALVQVLLTDLGGCSGHY